MDVLDNTCHRREARPARLPHLRLISRSFSGRYSGYATAGIFLLAACLGVIVPRNACAQPEPDALQSTVFVIDVSTSMFDIMDDLKNALKEYASEAGAGDSIAIVTFGKGAQLHYRRTVNCSADVQRLLQFCDNLSCPDEYTNISCGLEKGIEELYQFYQKNPLGKHQLVLMSDGRDNPPPDAENPVTFQSIEERYFDVFVPGKDWFITYFALKGIKDRKLADFVEKWGGFHWDPKKLERIAEIQIDPGLPGGNHDIDLGNVDAHVSKQIPLFISPVKGNPQGMQVRVEPRITTFAADPDIMVRVSPSTFQCTSARARHEITLTIDGHCDGDISGTLRFMPEDKSFLIVYPTQLSFLLKKLPMLTVLQPGPVELGPLVRGGELFEKRIPLSLDGPLPAGNFNIQVAPEIELPQGITCSARVNLQPEDGSSPYIFVSARAFGDAPLDKTWVGEIVLKSSSGCPIFSQSAIPLKIMMPSMGEDELPILKWIAFGIIFATILTGLVAIGHNAYHRRVFVPLEGWLIALEKPEGIKMPNIDLNKISREHRKKSLIFGSGRSCDVRLAHDSIDEKHLEIRRLRNRKLASVHLRDLSSRGVVINNAPLKEEVPLQDRDIIEFGGFQLLYSNSHLKQVVVHYKDGDVKYGVPLTWNIEEKGFVLRPEGTGASDLQIFIPFMELKGVFFVKDFDKEIARKVDFPSLYAEKDHVIAKFKDGEIIEGFTIRDYDPKSPRFLMVPKVVPGKEENNLCILVEKKFVQKIKVVSDSSASKKKVRA